MIRLFETEGYGFKDFPDFIFSEDTTLVGANSVIINEVEYYLPSQYEDLAELIRNWGDIPGNRLEYEYFSGVEDENPSGSANIKFIKYHDRTLEVKFHQTFIWDISNKIIGQQTIKGNTP
mgnify:CR=1 FL=1